MKKLLGEELREIRGGGVLKPERVRAICPACGQQVEAVAWDGRVKGYCAVARQYVDFLAIRRLSAKARAKMSAAHTNKHPSTETRAKISATLKRWYQQKGNI